MKLLVLCDYCHLPADADEMTLIMDDNLYQCENCWRTI